jgi:hypothetical protein
MFTKQQVMAVSGPSQVSLGAVADTVELGNASALLADFVSLQALTNPLSSSRPTI